MLNFEDSPINPHILMEMKDMGGGTVMITKHLFLQEECPQPQDELMDRVGNGAVYEVIPITANSPLYQLAEFGQIEPMIIVMSNPEEEVTELNTYVKTIVVLTNGTYSYYLVKRKEYDTLKELALKFEVCMQEGFIPVDSEWVSLYPYMFEEAEEGDN